MTAILTELQRLRELSEEGGATLSPEAQRIAIAEACGWTDCHFPLASNVSLPFTERVVCGIAPGRQVHSPLPDYLSDLNAMHEAEKVLTQVQRVDYMNHLADACGSQCEKPFATAAQRAEAFLRCIGA